MRKQLIIITLFACSLPLFAQGQVASEDTVRTTNVQTRVGVSFTKEFNPRWSLTIDEELRIVAYEKDLIANQAADPSAYFSKSYTTLGVHYDPIEYLGFGADYTLKLYAQKGWEEPAEFIRHRLAFAVIGKYAYNNWRFSLRERLVADMRADEVDVREKPKTALELRHRLHVAYSDPYKRWRPYLDLTLVNTLNQPKSPVNDPLTGRPYWGGQYLESIRVKAGVRFKIDLQNALNFYYRFDTSWNNKYTLDSDANADITHETTLTHIIGLAYEFDW